MAVPRLDAGRFQPATCKSFAVLQGAGRRFFDDVMVMVDDEALRTSRLALLSDLRTADEPRRRHFHGSARMKLVILDRDGVINLDSDRLHQVAGRMEPDSGQPRRRSRG